MAFSLFTFHADLKPVSTALNRLADVGERIARTLERAHPDPARRVTPTTPLGPEAWTIEGPGQRADRIAHERVVGGMSKDLSDPDVQEPAWAKTKRH